MAFLIKYKTKVITSKINREKLKQADVCKLRCGHKIEVN